MLVPVDLGPLSQTHTAALVHELVQTEGKSFKPESAIPKIWAVSRGNPFMIVEAVQALGDDAAAAVAGSVPLTPVVREVVAGRLARLSEQGRRLISIAAVIGRVFEFPVLQRASELRELEAAEAVDELIRRRLLNVAQHGLEVTHDWIRAVAYSELAASAPSDPARRRGAGGRAAVRRESGTPLFGPRPGTISRAKCGTRPSSTCMRPGARRPPASAIARRSRASRERSRHCSHLPETRETIERGVDHSPRPPVLHLRGSEISRRMIAHLRDAEPLARRLDDERRLGWVHAYMGYYFRTMRPPDEARPFTQSARAIAEKTGDRELAIEADYQQGDGVPLRGRARPRRRELLRRAIATGSAMGGAWAHACQRRRRDGRSRIHGVVAGRVRLLRGGRQAGR